MHNSVIHRCNNDVKVSGVFFVVWRVLVVGIGAFGCLVCSSAFCLLLYCGLNGCSVV